MRRVLTVEEMSSADAAAVEFGIPSLVLMERAALSVAEEIIKRKYDTSKVLVLCGSGNNGGDGAAIARLLAEKGIKAEIMLFGDPQRTSEQLKVQLKICRHYGIKITDEYISGGYSLVVDAIFGIGLHRNIEGKASEVIKAVNRDTVPVIAVDIASGIEGNTGKILGCAVKAQLTVTFGAPKIGHYIYPGAGYSGEVVIKDIGIPVESSSGTDIYNIGREDLERLPKRDESGNKGTFGKLLVIAGSRNICGAAYLCAAAALKSGAGMVRILTEERNRTALNVLIPEALIDTYIQGAFDKDVLLEALKWADGAVIGPGLGTDETGIQLLKCFLEENSLPAVFDADALNIISALGSDLKKVDTVSVITPHMGEMSRLINCSIKEIKDDPIGTAVNYAVSNDTVCILKDARTIIAYPDGKVFINTSGCSALSTAGSGDVLAGIVAAYLLRFGNTGLPVEAMAVMIHGTLGELAADRASRSAVVASDLLKMLNEIDY